MARTSLLLRYIHRRFSHSWARGFSFFIIPSTLALITSLFILFYVFTTSDLFSHHHPRSLRIKRPRLDLRSQVNFTSPLSNSSVSAPSRDAREAESGNQLDGNGHLGTDGEWSCSFDFSSTELDGINWEDWCCRSWWIHFRSMLNRVSETLTASTGNFVLIFAFWQQFFKWFSQSWAYFAFFSVTQFKA